jgi:DNA polymerase V
MTDAGIFDGDILIADRSIEPRSNDVVIAQIGDGFTVKRFKREQGRLRLVTENGGRPRPVDLGEEVHICGVVTFAIHKP